MRTVRIIGDAPSLQDMPPSPQGTEVWCCNHGKGIRKWLPRILRESEWTQWYNLHSLEHIRLTYPRWLLWAQVQTKPIYMAKTWPDIPSSLPFPRKAIQQFFAIDGKPFRYFTCSLAWLMAKALMESTQRVELWGFEIRKRKPAYAWERPCAFWWIQEARRRGVEVIYPEWLDWDLSEAGDPRTYTGVLYGFGTKPEPDWIED